ncbi:hypothetical protein EV646_102436 [Kribbella antiqua]|uniref:Uncharacterized protein n=1 Tax=Kribbella antiqua TaxID=2512217 RepID=A0A4R2IZF8_9ACTN|nr:hypothetical protein [Kribbella antiqua]TCO50362.1 hypothetical protein EV646_102436 [Kribbella antiqua]
MAEKPEGRTRRLAAIVGAAAAVFVVSALLVGLGVLFLGGGPASAPGQGALPLPGASTTPTRASTPPTTPPRTSSTPSTSPTPTRAPTTTRSSTPVTTKPFAYQPLWPFASVTAAEEWQRKYRDGGQQPWHLDADQTALSFTTGFLGFTELDTVVSRSIKGDDARISVGSGSRVAAVLHLVRIGQGTDAPWEVVGTSDTTLTVERPRYGASATSPITVGGRITGVDESIRIDVRQPSSESPLGSFCCIQAGGERQPWSAQVSFRGATDPALTVVASTGGHVQSVERFAVTAIRAGNS